MKLNKLVLGSLVALLNITSSYASGGVEEYLKSVERKPAGTLKAGNISSDDRIPEILKRAGKEYKAGDDQHNWMNLIQSVSNPDQTLNELGYDVWDVNNSFTGRKESARALDTWRGKRERERIAGQVEHAGEKAGHAIERGGQKVMDAFSR